jgi:hypothetical protein
VSTEPIQFSSLERKIVDRKQQKQQLLRDFGRLMAPLRAIVNDPAAHDQNRRERHLGEYQLQREQFYPMTEAFIRSDPTALYQTKYQTIVQSLVGLASELDPVLADHEKIKPILDRCEQQAIHAIESIPVD